MPFPCRFRKTKHVTKCTNKTPTGSSRTPSRTTTTASTSTSKTHTTSKNTASKNTASKQTSSKPNSKENTPTGSRTSSKEKISVAHHKKTSKGPYIPSAPPSDRHANCYKSTSKVLTTGSRTPTPSRVATNKTSSATPSKVSTKASHRTSSASSTASRGRSSNRQRGHEATSSGKSDQKSDTKNSALQTCRSTGVGDCPACLMAKNECHADKCKLCCGLKFCGPEFENCPFVNGLATQTEPLCESTGYPCECVDTSCNTSKACILVDRLVFDNVREMITKTNHSDSYYTTSSANAMSPANASFLANAGANQMSFSRAETDRISLAQSNVGRPSGADTRCLPNADRVLKSEVDNRYSTKPTLDQLALLQAEVNRLSYLQAEINRLSMLRSGVNTNYLTKQDVDEICSPQPEAHLLSYGQSKDQPPGYGHQSEKQPPSCGPQSIQQPPGGGHAELSSKGSTESMGDTTHTTKSKADTRYLKQTDGSSKYCTNSIDDTGYPTKSKVDTRSSTKPNGNKLSVVQPKTDKTKISDGKVETRNSLKTDGNKRKLSKVSADSKGSTNKNSNKSSASSQPGVDPSCCVQAGLPEKCSSYRPGKKRDSSPSNRKSNVDIISLGPDVEILIAPKSGKDKFYFPEDGVAVEVSQPLQFQKITERGNKRDSGCRESCKENCGQSAKIGEDGKVSVAVPSGKCACRKPADIIAEQRRKSSTE